MISVPFHRRMPNPGPCDYTVPDFHHRRLVSIIREKLSDPYHHSIYHYEPYELRWHPPNKAPNVRVHGELYTSDAFIKAQENLLASSPEPDCDLPRCIAAPYSGVQSFGHFTYILVISQSTFAASQAQTYVLMSPTSNQ